MVRIVLPKGLFLPRITFRVLSQTMNRTKTFDDMRVSFIKAVSENIDDMKNDGVTAMDCAKFLDLVVKNRYYVIE